MRKTYIVTVEIDEEACIDLDGGPILAIGEALQSNRFVYNPQVTLAPDELQVTRAIDA